MSSQLGSITSEIQVDINPFTNGEILFTAPLSKMQHAVWTFIQTGHKASCDFRIALDQISTHLHLPPAIQEAIVILGAPPLEVALISDFFHQPQPQQSLPSRSLAVKNLQSKRSLTARSFSSLSVLRSYLSRQIAQPITAHYRNLIEANSYSVTLKFGLRREKYE